MYDESGDVRTFTILVRQFFGRFFDNEALSPQADATTNLGPVLGILAVPGAFMVLLLQTLTLTGWGLVTFRYFLVAFSMLAMAFLTVFKWDALFLDRRDYLILTPLPIRSYVVFLAKLTAFGLFLGLFLLDINLLSMLMWPGVDRSGSGVAVMAAHAASCSAAGLFAALSAGLASRAPAHGAQPCRIPPHVRVAADAIHGRADYAALPDPDAGTSGKAAGGDAASVRAVVSRVLVRRAI